jgi:hypothetical protein
VPTATICTDEFAYLAHNEAEALGLPWLPLVAIPHPLGGVPPEEVRGKADRAVDEVVQALTASVKELMAGAGKAYPPPRYLCTDEVCLYQPTLEVAETIHVEDSPEAINQAFCEQSWCDGLPIVPPTPDRVARMIEGVGRNVGEVVGILAPRRGVATVEKIAVNAIMAGCRPEYLPILIAAVEAMAEESFNLYGVQTTTGPHAPLLIVNGPVVRKARLNFGHNAFGPGWRSNATIGRAIRLILLNIGGGIPGTVDKATQGQPSKYTFCIAENEEANPWQPLHAERGFDPEASTVTVVAGESPHNINEHVNITARGVMTTIVDSMTTMGTAKLYRTKSESLLLLCPEHAAIIARDGWSKEDIRHFIIENARKPLGLVKQGGMLGPHGHWPKWLDTNDDQTMIPLHQDPKDILIVVVGGAGRHSSFVPTWGQSRSVTRRILFPE